MENDGEWFLSWLRIVVSVSRPRFCVLSALRLGRKPCNTLKQYRSTMKSFFSEIILLSSFSAFGCEKPASNANGAVPSPTPPVSTNANTPATMALPMPQRVTFVSADKTPIVGTFYGSPNPNSPAVLMLHQWMSDRHFTTNSP